MATLLTLQALSGRLRRNPRFDRALSNLPLLLVANGAALTENLRKAKIVDDELRQKLRLAGVHSYDDVVAVILERTGAVSVMRQGETIASDLLSDVRGREALAREHIRP
jgi:uncharacterized membrane protein YcaP (DUF421 family)